ncbi:MAG: NAD(P)/FAD-dependent oxidoreductase [Planctomycetota bacterium]|nr:NAD(P)/FAD-dependent oxidoreductase [Planctomycetota bacterium]
MNKTEVWDAVIIGGGLAGLTAAARLIKLGQSVLVLEAGKALGGRGRTQELDGGYLFNMGAHALYRGSHGARVLKDLGVSYSGRCPSTSGNYVSIQGEMAVLPGGALSIFTTSLFRNWREKGAALKSFMKVMSSKAKKLEGQTVSQWLGEVTGEARVRDFFHALIRLVSYSNQPDRFCAAAALEQLQNALTGNVLYLDGGWGSLVKSLSAIITDSGGIIHCGRPVTGLKKTGHFEVETKDELFLARAIILACPPEKAQSLLKGVSEFKWQKPEPLIASCLDLALKKLPDAKKLFVLGVDDPSYLSVHSQYAKLAPDEGAIVHCLLYGGPGNLSDEECRGVLERLLDKAQPGWRESVVHERFLPKMIVAGSLPEAIHGGISGRPGVCIEGQDGVYLCGDWVGSKGQLADASLSSGSEAALAAAVFLKSCVCGVG